MKKFLALVLLTLIFVVQGWSATLIAEYRMDDINWSGAKAVVDTVGGYNSSGTLDTTGTASTTITNAKLCRSGLFSGGAVNIGNLGVSTAAGAKTSVSFWMKWDGTNSVMPFGWLRHDLWFSGSNFGFNTANSDIYGISTTGLANGWHHVAAVFTNGSVTTNQLYIDGVSQTLTQRASSPSNASAIVQSSARIGGWLNDTGYRFRTMLDEVKVFNGALTSAEISSIYTNENAGKNWDGTTRSCNVNTPPVAVNDSAFTDKNTSVDINVTTNDTDSDGTINKTTVTIVTPPSHGSTAINATTGVVTYTPTTGYTGSDSFTYTVKDNLAATSNIATVSITVNNPPVAVNDSKSTYIDSSVDINVTANDTDSDGTINKTTVTIVTTPSHGSTVINTTTGVITYTPTTGYTGSDSFTYTVKDDRNATSNIATVSITVNKIPPLTDYRFDECQWNGTAGEVKDSSGSNYNATARSGNSTVVPQVSAQIINNGALFSRTSQQYVELPTLAQSQPNFNDGFSVTTWAKFSAAGAWERIFDIGNGTDANNIFLGRQNTSNNLVLGIHDPGTDNYLVATNAIADTNWHFWGITCDGNGGCRLYKDGVKIAQSSTMKIPANIARTKNYIGKSNWSADAYFEGGVDEFKIFDANLSDTQIQNIYNYESSHKNYDNTPRPSIMCELPPLLSISAQSYYEGNTTNSINFPITVTGYLGSTTYNVDFNTSNGTAIAGTDYNATNQKVSITGNGTINIPISLYGDTKYDQNKTFNVALSNASTGVTLSGSPALVTILNDDLPPYVTINDTNITEGNTTNTSSVINVTLSSVSNLSTDVYLTTTDGTAISSIDYTGVTNLKVTIPAGQTSASVPIQILGNTRYGPDKTFSITITSAVNALLDTNTSAIVTILNDDARPTMNITPSTSILEGGSGTKSATVTVTLDYSSEQTITANYVTADGTATSGGALSTGGQDYVPTSGTITFNPGETSKDIIITINGDLLYEPDENFSITLSNIQNALAGNSVGTVIIANDDSLPALSINSVSANEGNTANTPFVFTVTATNASAQPFTFSYSTRDATAKSYPYAPDSFGTTSPYTLLYNPGKQDYNATSGVLTFAPGETTKTITVNVIGNTIFEPNKVFYVDIVSASGATINPLGKSGTGTIQNDDTSFAGPNVRDFKTVYSNTFAGNVKVFGNTAMVKNATGCTIGTESACNPGTSRNNDVNVKFTKIDTSTGAATTNSSADLSTTLVPAGSTVKWAGLYWQGYLCGDEKSTPSQKSSTVNVKLKRPGDTSYQTVQADLLNWVYLASNGSCNGGTERWYYQGSKNITSLINTTSPQGTYYVGDIVSQIGQPAGGSFGGWSIAVVYENTTTETIKNVVVYDGYMAIAAGADLSQKGVLNSFSTTLDGFITPRKSPISSTFLWFAGEGDVGSTGDAITLTKSDNTVVSLSNSTNPANDIANSTITYKNAYVTNRAPNWQNTIGLDIDDFDISSILSPCQSQTKATLTSSGDGYFPGMFAFSTEVAQGTACYNQGAVFNFVSTGKVTDGKDDNSPAYENALYTQVTNQGTSSMDLLAKREYQPNGLVSDGKTLMSFPGYKGIVHIDFVRPTTSACDQKIALGSDYNISFAQGYTNRLPVAVNFPQIDTNLSARVRYLVNDSGFAEPWECDNMSTDCILNFLVNKRGATVCLNECNSTKGATLNGCMACVFDSAKAITTAYPSDPNTAIPATITDKTKLSRVACSADSFAVRPDRFSVTSSKSLIYPGDTFTLTITAVDAVGNIITSYAPTYNSTNFTSTVTGGTLGSVSGFTNGIATVTVTAGAITGNFTFSIAEKSPKEYAIIDANDGSGASRFITNGLYTFYVSPILTNLNLMMDECTWGNGVTSAVKDSSGNGLHGTAYNASTTAATNNFKSYRAGDFTSPNSWVEIPDNVLLRPNNLTAMLWFKPNGTQSNYVGIMMKGSSNNWQASAKSWNDGYGFYINKSSKLCFYIDNSSAASVCSTTSIASGTWMHAAASYDGSILKLYINGALTPEATLAYSSSTNLINLSTGKLYMAESTQNGQNFKGYLDEAHLMDRALLPSQINGIYTNENSGKDLNGQTKTTASCAYNVNLNVSKTPNNLSLLPNESATFALSATNSTTSGGTADNVSITDIVPSVLSITSVSSGCSVSGQTVTCLAPSLLVGGSASYTVNTKVISSATSGAYTNTATVASTQTNTGTSISSVNFTVLNNPKFDAFDTTNFGNKKLYTRAVNHLANFLIYSLNQTGTATQNYNSSLVGVRVVDAISCPSGGSGSWNDLNLSNGTASFSYTPTRAAKNLKLQFATKNSAYTDATCSSDTFSVRPSKFSLSAISLRAGEDLNTTALNGGTGYNGNAYVITKLKTSNTNCSTQTNFLLNNEQSTPLIFVADHNNSTLMAKDIGIVNVAITDTTWTQEDKGNGDCDPTILDDTISNGKAGCDINTSLDLTINPYQLTTTKESFTPSTTTPWLYLDSSRTQHVEIKTDIIAYDKIGNITKNFSDGCFGTTVPLGFYFTNSGTLPSNITASLTSTTGSNNTIADINNTYNTVFNTSYFSVPTSSFKDGTSLLSLKFNFIRSSSSPMNPFNLKLTSINTNDTNGIINNNATNLDNNATFVYGRVHAYDVATNVSPAPNPVEFEVYSSTSNGFVSGMPQNILHWYRNLNHDMATYGNVIQGGFTAGGNDSAINTSAIPVNGVQMLTVTSNQDQTVHLDISPWLWYSSNNNYNYSLGSLCTQHPCFNYDYTDASLGVKGVNSGTFNGSDFQMTPAKNITNKGVKLFR